MPIFVSHGPEVAAGGPGGFLHHLAEMAGEQYLFVFRGQGRFHVQHVTASLCPGEAGCDARVERIPLLVRFEFLRAQQLIAASAASTVSVSVSASTTWRARLRASRPMVPVPARARPASRV